MEGRAGICVWLRAERRSANLNEGRSDGPGSDDGIVTETSDHIKGAACSNGL